MINITLEQFRQRAVELFGTNIADWEYVCPSCGNIAKGSDFPDPNRALRECVGRHKGGAEPFSGGKPCTYHLSFLVEVHDIEIEGAPAFRLNDPLWSQSER